MALSDRPTRSGHLDPVNVANETLQVAGDIDLVDGAEVRILGLEGSTDTYQVPRLDGSTFTLQTIDYVHHEVHSGSKYESSIVDVDLDATDLLTLAFWTPDTEKEMHMFFEASNTSSALVEVLESPTITNGTGTDVACYNRNRRSDKTPTCLSVESPPVVALMTRNPTITADGTVLHSYYVGVGKNKASSGNRDEEERVLGRNRLYAVRITGLADNGNAAIEAGWYEHTPKA